MLQTDIISNLTITTRGQWWATVNACELYYAVVYGAIGERQATNGAQPSDVGTQVVGHGVSPVQPSAVDHVQHGRTAAARGIRRAAGPVRPA